MSNANEENEGVPRGRNRHEEDAPAAEEEEEARRAGIGFERENDHQDEEWEDEFASSDEADDDEDDYLPFEYLMHCLDVAVLDENTFGARDRFGHILFVAEEDPIQSFLEHNSMNPSRFENVNLTGPISKMLDKNPEKLEHLFTEMLTHLPAFLRLRVYLPSRIPRMGTFLRLLRTHVYPQLIAVNEDVQVRVERNSIQVSERQCFRRVVSLQVDEDFSYDGTLVDGHRTNAADGIPSALRRGRRSSSGGGDGGLECWYGPFLEEVLRLPNVRAVDISANVLSTTFQEICSLPSLVSLILSNINTCKDRFEFVTLANALTPQGGGQKRKRNGGLINVSGKLANLESLSLRDIVLNPEGMELLRVTMLSNTTIQTFSIANFRVESSPPVTEEQLWATFLGIFNYNKTLTSMDVKPGNLSETDWQYGNVLEGKVHRALVDHNHTIQGFSFGFSYSDEIKHRLDLNLFGLASITGPSCTREQFQAALIVAVEQDKPRHLFRVLFQLFQDHPHLVAFLE